MHTRTSPFVLCLLVPLAVTSCLPKPIETRELAGGTLATMRPPEEIPSLHDPRFLTVDEVGNSMRDGEKVLGFETGGRPMAIALRVLDDHEIVNGNPGNDPADAFAATW